MHANVLLIEEGICKPLLAIGLLKMRRTFANSFAVNGNHNVLVVTHLIG